MSDRRDGDKLGFEGLGSKRDYHNREPRASFRASPHMLRWLDTRGRTIGMQRSQYIRFVIEMEMFREIIQKVIVSNPDRLRFINGISKKYGMTPSQYIGFVIDFMQVIDDDVTGKEETLFQIILWKLFPDEDKQRKTVGIPQVSRLKIPPELRNKRFKEVKEMLDADDDDGDKMDYEIEDDGVIE